jgi:DNA-binding response OmpR family regulator
VSAATDRALRMRLERAAGMHAIGSTIVTADLGALAALRAANPGASIVIVALRRAELAAALDGGADVALAGQPRPAELAAHIRALARRSEASWIVGPLLLDRSARTLTFDGTEVRVPRREFALLCCLASEPGRVFTKAELLRSCWERGDARARSRTLERHAARLRRRLGRHGPMLVTVWGAGYRLDALA